MPLLDAEQRHQREDAALAVVVDAHREGDVFDAVITNRVQTISDSAPSVVGGVGIAAGEVEHGFERVERARADVAEHDPQRREAHRPEGGRW